MTTIEKQAEIKAKGLFGLAKTHESVLVYKKKKARSVNPQRQ
ncbi:hypothetical protein [Arsenicibacter rosenii]|nr:hypothetical protein [Arsenicibacter rosenii]